MPPTQRVTCSTKLPKKCIFYIDPPLYVHHRSRETTSSQLNTNISFSHSRRTTGVLSLSQQKIVLKRATHCGTFTWHILSLYKQAVLKDSYPLAWLLVRLCVLSFFTLYQQHYHFSSLPASYNVTSAMISTYYELVKLLF